MLIELAVTNFRSIKERQVFSMLASNRIKQEERKSPVLKNQKYPDLDLLPTAVIYGANNAGKSNLIKAFRALEWLVMRSHRFTVGDALESSEYFAFNKDTIDQPTIFEIEFIASDSVHYRFIIEFTQKDVIREELHFFTKSETGKSTKRKLYIRKIGQAIEFGDEFKGARKTIEERLIPNVLFLSKAISENNTQLLPIFNFFQRDLYISDLSDGYTDFQARYFGKISMEKDGSKKMEALNATLRSVDSGILYLGVAKTTKIPSQFILDSNEDEDKMNEKEKQARESFLDTLKHEIKAFHRFFDGKKETGTASISLSEESEGTRKFIAVFTKLIELEETGGVFIVDELQRSLHPLLVQAIIQLITKQSSNPNQVQLIFSSHDTTMFDVLDRDQIVLLDKDEYGATEIYRVSEIKGLRNEVPLQKWYLSGKLAGIPGIDFAKMNMTVG